MKKSNLKGFGTVFKHNLRIHMKSTKYIVSTILIALILFMGMGALIFFLTKSSAEDKDYEYAIDEVYVVDETGIGIPDYAMLAMVMQLGYGENTRYISSDKSAMDTIKDDSVDYMIVQKKVDDEYIIQVVTGEDIDTDKAQVEGNLDKLAELVKAGFQNYLYISSGLNEEQVVQVLLPVLSKTEQIGEEKMDEGKQIMGFAVTFVIVMLIYFLVLIYGTEICADVPMEKTSKLVEQLLMAVSPYALVSGKILGTIVSCIIQFIIWIVSLFGGIIAGDVIVRNVLDLEHSFVSTALDSIEKWFSGAGFTISGIILAVLSLIVGLVLYLLLAGVGGATLSKPEQAGNVQSVFVLPLLISYFAIFLGTDLSSGSFDIPMIYHMIPFTAAMTAPSGVLLGTLSIPMAILSLGISIVVCLFALYIAAKLYEGLLFFNGNKLKIKDIIRVFKSKQ